MLGLRKINWKVFNKLYHYYWQKLLRRWLFFALFLGLGAFLTVAWISSVGKIMEQKKSWSEVLTGFYLLSGFQLFIMKMIIPYLIFELVGLRVNFGFFQKPTKDSTEDSKVIIFTPKVNRETIILAKFALIFTIFLIVSLLITLPLFIYLFTFPNLTPSFNFVFLLLNGFVWTIQNFLLLVPNDFYFAENYSFIGNLLSAFFLFILGGFFWLFYFLSIKISVFMLLLSFPFSLLVGWIFWSLYCRKFLRKDIT